MWFCVCNIFRLVYVHTYIIHLYYLTVILYIAYIIYSLIRIIQAHRKLGILKDRVHPYIFFTVYSTLKDGSGFFLTGKSNFKEFNFFNVRLFILCPRTCYYYRTVVVEVTFVWACVLLWNFRHTVASRKKWANSSRNPRLTQHAAVTQ